MITHIRMKSFKSWKDSGKVELAPLTGFFGTNSSGKSSLLQMLLVLKQTAQDSNPDEVISFGNKESFINLGSFKDVIFGHLEDETLELEFGCNLKKPIILDVYGNQDLMIKIESFTFNTSIASLASNLYVPELKYLVKNPTSITISWKDREMLVEFNSQPERDKIHDTSYGDRNCYGKTSKGYKELRLFTDAFETLFSYVFYLGPTRVDPQRFYNWQGTHPKDIKQWGNQTIDALLSARVRKLKTNQDKEKIPIEDKISMWLQDMDLAHSFSLDLMPKGAQDYEVKVQKSPLSPPVTLVDMGYGLGQFLPVLVLCYYAPERSTLILEQPGIHLHPRVQSQVADLLIEVVKERNIQILVESHSEHLLNRLQRRIAEEKITVDETALYFCRNDDGESKIEQLKMDEFGNISNWPDKFFGDEMGDLFAMTEAQNKRQKRMES